MTLVATTSAIMILFVFACFINDDDLYFAPQQVHLYPLRGRQRGEEGGARGQQGSVSGHLAIPAEKKYYQHPYNGEKENTRRSVLGYVCLTSD